MMVDSTATSLIAEFTDAEDHEIGARVPSRTATRFATTRREQPSRIKQATAARYSRKRNANSNAPTGPRRRFRKG